MCHSLDGYLAIRPLVAGQDAEGLSAFLEALRAGRPGMPPIVGTDEEIESLAEYLVSLANASPRATVGPIRTAQGTGLGGAK